MQQRFKYVIAALCVLLILAVFMRWPASSPAAAGRDALPSNTMPRPAQREAALVNQNLTPLSASPEPSLTAQVDALVITHDPDKAYAAYNLISDCARFNLDHDRAIYDLAEVTSKRSVMPYRGMTEAEKRRDAVLCAGMTERMRVSRLDYLATAVKAGVRGAIVSMAEEGPFGDPSALTSRPDDPLVNEWKRNVTEQLLATAEQGDIGVLTILWAKMATGDALLSRNPALAYRYGVAQGLIYRDLNGPSSPMAEMFAPDGQLMGSLDGLSAEQRAAELAEAERIAATDHARRERRRQHQG